MGNILKDVKYGFRMLVKNPGFTIVAALTLALGIGANTAIFSVVNSLFLHPVGIPQPDRLLAVRVKYDKLNLKDITISLTDYADVRDAKQIFSSAAIMMPSDFNYSASDLPERLLGAQVSWQWFEVFGAQPILGRTFHSEEDLPGANLEVILSFGTWKQLFGGDAGIVGTTIQLNQQPYRVIGVMGPDFDWPNQTRLWVPLGLAPKEFGPENRFNEGYFAVARIRPEVSVAQAEAFVKVRGNQAVQSNGEAAVYAKDSEWGMFGVPLTEFVFGNLKTPMLILMGAVGFVLLIACSNIAGLMLAKSSTRGKELAVRSALGASRWDLIRQTLVESMVLGGIGTMAGLALAQAGIRILTSLAPQQESGVNIQADPYVLIFAIIAGLLSAIFFGIAPAWQASGPSHFEALKEGGRSGTAGTSQQRLRSLLVAGEVAMALVLLVGAGLFLKSLARIQQVVPGFDPHGVITAALTLPDSQYKEEQKQIEFYRAITERLASLPGVTSAAATYPLPFSGSGGSSSFSIEGRPEGPGDPGPHSDLQAVTPAYFSTMRVPVREGRTFTEQDREGVDPVVVIDENLAGQYWPNQDPVGKRLRRGTRSKWATIVGVVGHVDRNALVGDSGKGVCFYPMYQVPIAQAYLIARTPGDPASFASPLRQAVRAIDPNQPVYELTPLDQLVAASLGPRRFAVTLLGFFAAMALLMAALGLYGVVSYSVTQRTQEFGIRMALGARSGQVLVLVIKQGMKLVGAGVLIGLVIALVLARLLASELFGVRAFDPITFALMALTLVVIALLACFIPARRATKVDPMVALRYE
ncbi:MAG TPA: ABC transporter permease [Terriglobia bacterium]|nr:ABC transporter permease [Terriglobia bacterium]